MSIQFENGKLICDDVNLAKNYLAFAHYPVEIEANDKKHVFDSFLEAEKFVEEIFAKNN